MIRRITLENFMSHALTVIEPAEGLTVLTGPNNCGKSAVVTALRTLCRNARGDYMVRHGAPFSRVAVETGDGHILEWKRKGDVVSYRIDGRDIHRVGGSVPDDLHRLLRLGNVEGSEGDDGFDIHLAEQKSPIFLLDRPGREAALFFAASSDASYLMKMQTSHRQKVLERKRDAERLAADLDRRGRLAEALGPVEEIGARLEREEEAFVRIRQEAEGIACMEKDLGNLTGALGGLEKARGRARALENVPAPPPLADTALLKEALRHLASTGAARGQAAERLEALLHLAPPPSLEDTAPLENLRASLAAAHHGVHRMGERAASLQRLPEPPAIAGEEPLDARIREMHRVLGAQAAARERVRALSALPPPPQIADPSGFQEAISALARALAARAEGQERLGAAQEGLDATAEAIRGWARGNPACPTCGAPVEAERILSAGGAHDHG